MTRRKRNIIAAVIIIAPAVAWIAASIVLNFPPVIVLAGGSAIGVVNSFVMIELARIDTID